MLDRFKRTYEIQTAETVNAILHSIEERAERQNKHKLLFASEPVNYKNLSIFDHSIEIDRNPTLFNPFRGTGNITFNLIPNPLGTTIKCSINPSQLGMTFSFGLVLLFLLIVTISVFSSIEKFYLGTILFMAIFWILPLALTNFACNINTVRLESLSKTFLYDLGLLSPDK